MSRIIDKRDQLLEWTQEEVKARDCFLVFLSGTLSASNATRTTGSVLGLQSKYRSSLMCLGGSLGALELIADYAGIIRGGRLRIMRGLVGSLAAFLEDVPKGQYG